MCNRARFRGEPDAIWGSAAKLFTERPRDDRFDPHELWPWGRNYVVREHNGERAWDVMTWDLLRGEAAWKIINVRNLALSQWRKLAERPENRCVVPLTEFCEFTCEKHDLGDGECPLKGEMWFQVTDQPVFAVAGLWQRTKGGNGFAMVTCDPNGLFEPLHRKATLTILNPEDVTTWLRGSYNEAVALQRPYPGERMRVRGPLFPTRAQP